MRRCPQCGTEYENHVPQCLADGSELVDLTEEAPKGRSILPILIAIPVLGLVLVGVAGVAFLAGTGTAAPPPPEPETLSVVSVEDPPDPEPVEPAPAEVAFVTLPEGSDIFENGQLVCTAPCKVEHPAHAPLPRTFIVKHEGYRDREFEMESAEGPFLVELEKARPDPRPRPRPRPAPVSPTPTPKPVPTTPRPSIKRDRGAGEQ